MPERSTRRDGEGAAAAPLQRRVTFDVPSKPSPSKGLAPPSGRDHVSQQMQALARAYVRDEANPEVVASFIGTGSELLAGHVRAVSERHADQRTSSTGLVTGPVLAGVLEHAEQQPEHRSWVQKVCGQIIRANNDVAFFCSALLSEGTAAHDPAFQSACLVTLLVASERLWGDARPKGHRRGNAIVALVPFLNAVELQCKAWRPTLPVTAPVIRPAAPRIDRVLRADDGRALINLFGDSPFIYTLLARLPQPAVAAVHDVMQAVRDTGSPPLFPGLRLAMAARMRPASRFR
ncbi:MAG TPA: hypothetical protein VFH51_01350 [Myxococcota bacterium]|nr:hypothetical protein [Myxococcota bacterium]